MPERDFPVADKICNNIGNLETNNLQQYKIPMLKPSLRLLSVHKQPSPQPLLKESYKRVLFLFFVITVISVVITVVFAVILAVVSSVISAVVLAVITLAVKCNFVKNTS